MKKSKTENETVNIADHASAHVTPASGNVFFDLGFAPGEAEQLKARSDAIISDKIRIKETLMTELADWIVQNRLKQMDAAHVLGINRPRVSDLIRKKSAKFTIDALVDMMTRTGREVRVCISGVTAATSNE